VGVREFRAFLRCGSIAGALARWCPFSCPTCAGVSDLRGLARVRIAYRKTQIRALLGFHSPACDLR